MDGDQARQLFESGGILLVLDAPKEMSFAIDMYSWQIGPQFQGIKMIPPGLHFCSYAERESHRQSFFFEIRQPDQMFVVVRWSKSENLFQREVLTPDQHETRRNQRYELDRCLGQYPLDTYRQWLALANHLQSAWIEKILPPNGHVCSVEVFEPSREKHSTHQPFEPPKNLHEAEARLPQMTLNEDFAFRFTKIDRKKSSQSGSALTEEKLDRTNEIERLIGERFDGKIEGFLCELQLSFVVFLLGQCYEGFEQWKTLLSLICSSQQAFRRWTMFYVEFLQALYFQLKHFTDESAPNEHFFVDIDQQENYIYKALENLFLNVQAWNDDEQMENNQREKLLERCEKMKRFLQQTYRWTFDEEPDDEKPVVVELN